MLCFVFFFFRQKTAYEMRISDWSSDVCSSDLPELRPRPRGPECRRGRSSGSRPAPRRPETPERATCLDPASVPASMIGTAPNTTAFGHIRRLHMLTLLRGRTFRTIDAAVLFLLAAIAGTSVAYAFPDRKSTRLNSSH